MLRFVTPVASFASDDVVVGFVILGSETLGASSAFAVAEALPFASFAALAARFSLRLRFLSYSRISMGYGKLLTKLPILPLQSRATPKPA
jgi:hypothetical protein